jgi:hypothetical protein
LFARAKPWFVAFLISIADGKSRSTITHESSVEALSTMMISCGVEVSFWSESKQSRMIRETL